MELLESTKSNITKNEGGDNVPHLEINEVILLHCNIANNNSQKKIQEFCLYLLLINDLVYY